MSNPILDDELATDELEEDEGWPDWPDWDQIEGMLQPTFSLSTTIEAHVRDQVRELQGQSAATVASCLGKRFGHDLDWRYLVEVVQLELMAAEAVERCRANGNPLVYRMTFPDSHPRCQELYRDAEGLPKLFRLRDLEQNGTNRSRDAADWLPVLGMDHAVCFCSLSVCPEGWGFDEGGDCAPDGEHKTIYDGRGVPIPRPSGDGQSQA